jgi:hypothetical protein
VAEHEHEDGERTAKMTPGRDAIGAGEPRRRRREPLWVWIVVAIVVCGLVGWGVYTALP